MSRTSAGILVLIYGIYALSPSYAQFRAKDGADEISGGPLYRGLQVGILWVNVLFDALTDAEQAGDHNRAEQILRSSQDEDMVLVKRKRAIQREDYSVRPHLDAGTVLAEDPLPLLPQSFSFGILHDPVHRHADGDHSLSAGLSPPPFLSLS